MNFVSYVTFNFDLSIICQTKRYFLTYVINWEYLNACLHCFYKSFVVYLIINGCRLLTLEMKQQLTMEYFGLWHSSIISYVKINHINHLGYYYTICQQAPKMSIDASSYSFFMLKNLLSNCFLDPMMRIFKVRNFITSRIMLLCSGFCAYSYLDFNVYSITSYHYNVITN